MKTLGLLLLFPIPVNRTMEWKFSKCLSARMAGILNISEVLLSTENLIEKRSLKILTTRQKILVMQVSKFSDCGLEFACFGIKKDSLAFSAIGKFVEDHFKLLDSDNSNQRGYIFFLILWKISTRPPTFSCGIVQTSLKF